MMNIYMILPAATLKKAAAAASGRDGFYEDLEEVDGTLNILQPKKRKT